MKFEDNQFCIVGDIAKKAAEMNRKAKKRKSLAKQLNELKRQPKGFRFLSPKKGKSD